MKRRKLKVAAQGHVSIENALQEMAEISHVFELYEQDLEDLKARARWMVRSTSWQSFIAALVFRRY